MLEKILITGGSGFIGSQAVRTLLSLNYQVFNLDKLTYASSKESLSNFESDLYTFHKGDIFDEKIISGLINKINPDYYLTFEEFIKDYKLYYNDLCKNKLYKYSNKINIIKNIIVVFGNIKK